MLPNRVFQILNEDGEPLDVDHAGNLAVFGSLEQAEQWINYIEAQHLIKGKITIEEIELIDYDDSVPELVEPAEPAEPVDLNQDRDFYREYIQRGGHISFRTTNELIGGEKISGFSIDDYEYFQRHYADEVENDEDEDA